LGGRSINQGNALRGQWNFLASVKRRSKEEGKMNRSKIQFTTIRMAVIAVALTFASAHYAYAQSPTPDKAMAKMTIVGIPGDNPDGTIEVVGIAQQTVNTGGKVSYSLVITKKIDRATPQLFLSNVQGASLSQVKIVWTKINPATNQEEFSHSISLSNVMLTTIQQRPADSSNPEARQIDEYEDLTFSVNSLAGTPTGKVTWEYALPGGRTLSRVGWDFPTARSF
jgi:type VI secretion system Hcp family effector